MQKINILFVLVLCSLTYSTNVLSQVSAVIGSGIHKCPQSDFVCGQCEKEDVEWLFGDDMGPEGSNPAEERNRGDFKNGLLADLSDPEKTINHPTSERSLLNNLNPFASSGVKVKDLKSVEDFISFLPDKFKKNVVFMSPSRSLQEGDRYLLKSKNSEIVMSFNSHPKEGGDMSELRGGKAVEMQVWNGAKAVWEYVEISFKDGKPEVTRNPQKCLNCHGTKSNTRPNFDSYNFWSQTKPAHRDTLVPNTRESEDYVKFLEKIESDSKAEKAGGPKTRFSVLAPMLTINPVADIKKRLAAGESVVLNTDTVKENGQTFSPNGDGAASVNLFDQMYLTNHCRIANVISNPKHNPYADQINFALKAALKGGCLESAADVKSFLPKSLIQNANNYFKKKGYGNGDLDAVTKTTEGLHRDYWEDRVGRKLWNIEEQKIKDIKESKKYKDQIEAAKGDEDKIYAIEVAADKKAYDQAKGDYDTIVNNSSQSIADKEETINKISPLRYLLEPLGIDTSMLSISVDPLSYTFGDRFGNLNGFGAFAKEPLANMACQQLKEESMKALSKDGVVQNILSLDLPCKEDVSPVLNGAWKKSLTDIEVQALREKRKDMQADVEDVLQYCAMCHSSGVNGAPPIPFHDMKELDNLLEKQAGELGNTQTRIWKRISRHEDLRGAMPMNMGKLDPEEVKTLKDYLESFPKRNYVNQIDTGSRRRNINNVYGKPVSN